MTSRQLDVLAYIRAFILVKQRPPSTRELCTRFGWRSRNSANDYIEALEKHGVLARDETGAVHVLGARLEWVEEGA